MERDAIERGEARGAAGDGPDASLPPACPRFATREEWEAWHRSLTWGQQLRRADLDPPEHEYSDREAAKADAREERRRARRWDPDPFSYTDDRRDGPWPRVDQLEVPALSNTWRMDPAYGYSPGVFARRMRRAPIASFSKNVSPPARGAIPRHALRGSSKRSNKEASLRAALKCVLRERHGRLSRDEAATARAMAWCHLVASRRQLESLRELARESRVEAERIRSQLALF